MRFIAVAIVGLAAVVGSATQAQTVTSSATITKDFTEDVDIDFDNAVDVDIAKSISVTQDVNYSGAVTISGTIDVSELAAATVDNKQIINDATVFLSGSEREASNTIFVGAELLESSDGNIGLNIASGDSILQKNSAAIAAQGALGANSGAESVVFSVQKSTSTVFDSTAEGDVLNAVQLVGGLLENASGNIGVNVATGAFHAQANILSEAAVTGSADLAQATSAVLQQTSFTQVVHSDTTNQVFLGASVLANASGNIGINVTAGTNNQQINSLILSVSQ